MSVGGGWGKWVIGCDHLMPGFARLYIVVARPGNFSEQASKGTRPATEFEFANTASAGTPASFLKPNWLSFEVAGKIVAAPANHRIVSGTFHGTWGTPEGACLSQPNAVCVEANLNVTFRLDSTYGYCFSNDDCVAPLECDPVAFACFN